MVIALRGWARGPPRAGIRLRGPRVPSSLPGPSGKLPPPPGRALRARLTGLPLLRGRPGPAQREGAAGWREPEGWMLNRWCRAERRCRPPPPRELQPSPLHAPGCRAATSRPEKGGRIPEPPGPHPAAPGSAGLTPQPGGQRGFRGQGAACFVCHRRGQPSQGQGQGLYSPEGSRASPPTLLAWTRLPLQTLSPITRGRFNPAGSQPPGSKCSWISSGRPSDCVLL